MNTEKYTYNLGQLFHVIASKQPNEIAIKGIDEKHVSYAELESLSNRLANFLIAKDIQECDTVAILHNNSITAYALMLACLKIGATYTNLDPKSPVERFEKMVHICAPKMIFYPEGLKLIDAIENTAILEIVIDYTNPDFLTAIHAYENDLPIRTSNIVGNTPAYIMFTSGSTGFPKGVVITHQNLLHFIDWVKATYEVTSLDAFTNINPLHFDNSVFDFYGSLFNGAALIPVTDKLRSNPRKLLEALNTLNPTIWFSVPSMLVFALNMRAIREEDISTLRIVTFGGEGFPKNQLRKLWSFWGDRVTFINVYGPTECTCICSSYIVSAEDLANDELLPLGPMAPNFYAKILDENGKEVNSGDIGELCIGGPNVGLGYYNNSEKTSEVFISDTTHATFHRRLYKSGDLVKEDIRRGVLLFCGRKDNQIKRMGYRIELEEIENAFNSLDFVEESAVVYVNTEKYPAKIVAFLRTGIRDEKHMKAILKNKLPLYMMPDIFEYIDVLPKNQNGKINRLLLKQQLQS